MSTLLIIWLYDESNGKPLHVGKLFQGEEEQNYVGRILEFFKTTEGEDYFRVQWFYRAEDTVSIWIASILGFLFYLLLFSVSLLLFLYISGYERRSCFP